TAREIQKDLLPDHPPRLESFDIEFFYSPAREIGGDYYDFFRLPENNLGLAIGDVTGKGIPAALTMASLKGNLAAQVQNIYSISEIMRRVNGAASTGAEGSSLTGLFYGVLNLDSGLLTYVNAGHNPPVLIKREGQTRLLTEGGLLLGALPGAAYDNGYVSIEAADILILYTDGITEAMNREGEEFGISRLVDVSLQSHDLSSRQIVSRILDSVNRHSAGQPRADDQTLVVVRRR
ncbi:MAG: PP2C family protein-serine/threonine phosphatase, partial [Candidatus Fermentibacter daniensis]